MEYFITWARWASEASSCPSLGTTLAERGPVALEADRFHLHGLGHVHGARVSHVVRGKLGQRGERLDSNWPFAMLFLQDILVSV